MLAASVILLVISAPARAGTITPTTTVPRAAGWGIDDWNVATLKPLDFITTSAFLAAARANPSYNGAFNDPNWTFDSARSSIPESDLQVGFYNAWAVVNDPVTDPIGTRRARPMYTKTAKADAGGVDFDLLYTPRSGTDDPGLNGILFLQIVQKTECISTDDSTCGKRISSTKFDTGSNTSPFYRGIGGNGNIQGSPDTAWMLDIPYDCENVLQSARVQGLNTGPAPSCLSSNPSGDDRFLILSAQVNFETFVATQNVVNGVHKVTLYGGVSWGFTYTNSDTAPEPAPFVLLGGGLVLAVIGGRRRVR